MMSTGSPMSGDSLGSTRWPSSASSNNNGPPPPPPPVPGSPPPVPNRNNSIAFSPSG
eukprot:CAMPEP_0170127228 /NCGR_PEP_ID=MMETSP0020_2-20130122/20282_1 /TAXON_ID=98059 /ORGANISM="Dinobryon sp., Strain UTEXLB2267" /LENGTH=56 /DNA_ID=CAMNT_0010360581 /DNA_START=32 /DNA_END=199 /DNA_ORIENTATION=-